MSDVSSLYSVVQRTTDFANNFAESAERVGDLLRSANQTKERFLSSIPFNLELPSSASLRATAARFGDAITSVNIPRSVNFGWGDAALLALGVVATVGLGGGIIAFAGWRVGSLAIAGLALLACNAGSDSPFIPKPPVRSDGGVVADLGSIPDLLPPIKPVKNFAYIPDFDNGIVKVIDTRTDAVTSSINGLANHSFGIAVTSKRAYVTSPEYGVYVIDTSVTPRRIVDSIPNFTVCGSGAGAMGIAVTPDEKKAYVSCWSFGSDCNQIGVFDTSTTKIIRRILDNSGSSKNCGGAIEVSPDGHNVYALRQSDSILVIDTNTDGVVTSISSKHSDPVSEGVAITSDSKKVYVTDSENNNVTVIDASTNKVIGTILVGKRSRGIVTVDLPTNPDLPPEHRAYVANHDDNTISVINTSTDTVVETIPVGRGPIGVSITSDKRKLYVLNADSKDVSVIDTYSNKVIATIPAVSSWAIGKFISPELP